MTGLNYERVSIMMNKTIFMGALFLIAGAVNAATTTLSQSQDQTVDGESFNFIFNNLGAYEVGSSSSFTISVQGDFNDIATPGSTAITIGGEDQGNFNRVSAEAYDVLLKGFNNINTYRYKLNFDLNAAQTEAFFSNSNVIVDFADEVLVLCGWWNYGNCIANVDDAPYAQVDYTYEVSSVPVPAAVWLFGSALLGLAGVARRKKV
ncbi:MAG: VPLPA-CTERM sorting domain-containing protein [Halioglobus sp.]|nr:VPLPA-CTERM sorting domain-containing protein [Halioglobus sp.]